MSDGQDSEFYQHSSLEHLAPDTIRLLQLRPGSGNDGLECEIILARLKDRPVYTALSYELGVAKARGSIRTDHKQFTIGRNLWTCLMSVRDSHTSSTFWVDAICVNQRDAAERNKQVRLMSYIFRYAKYVFAWLGEDSTLSRQALERLFHSPSDGLRSLDRYESDHTNPSVCKVAERLRDVLQSSEEGQVIVSAAWQAVADLCQRTYWTRTWIVQETALARRLVLRFGTNEISWGYFRYWCRIMVGFCANLLRKQCEDLINILAPCKELLRPLLGYCEVVNASRILSVQQTRVIGNKVKGAKLRTLIVRYSETRCSDSRDKVYALLSLCLDCETLLPDYEKSLGDVFFDVVRYYQHDFDFCITLQRALGVTSYQLWKASATRKDSAVFTSPIQTHAVVQGLLHSAFNHGPTDDHNCWPQLVLLRDLDDTLNQCETTLTSQSQKSSIALIAANEVVNVGDGVFKFALVDIYIHRSSKGRLHRTYLCDDIGQLPLPLSGHPVQSISPWYSSLDHSTDKSALQTIYGAACYDRRMLLEMIEWQSKNGMALTPSGTSSLTLLKQRLKRPSAEVAGKRLSLRLVAV